MTTNFVYEMLELNFDYPVTLRKNQQLKLATAFKSTLFTLAAKRRLQRLSWKCEDKGLQQTIAKVFELPPRLF
jgi:hypothetical protein